jgi:hypothetical protein
MNRVKAHNAQIYQNIMEILVNKEVNSQVRKLPSSLVRYIDPVEVATYALNRLPPLYASSQRGRQQQQIRGEKQLKEEIATAVRQALAAVQRDPLRSSIPLTPEANPDYQAAYQALQDLKALLQQRGLLDSEEDISWDNMVRLVRQSLQKLTQKVQTERIDPGDKLELDQHASQFHDWGDIRYQR